MLKVDSKSKYTVEDLLSIMKMLRAPRRLPLGQGTDARRASA